MVLEFQEFRLALRVLTPGSQQTLGPVAYRPAAEIRLAHRELSYGSVSNWSMNVVGNRLRRKPPSVADAPQRVVRLIIATKRPDFAVRSRIEHRIYCGRS